MILRHWLLNQIPQLFPPIKMEACHEEFGKCNAFVLRLLVMKTRLPDLLFLSLKGSVLQQIYGVSQVRGILGEFPSK